MQMNIIQPSRVTFWRFIFAVTALLPFLAIYQLLGEAKVLGVDFSASKPWMGLIGGLGLIGLLFLILLILTWSPYYERLLSLAESFERAPNRMRWVGILLLGLA